MRKLVLIAAAVPLLFAPSALAAEKKTKRQSICRVPDTDIRYAAETFTFLVVLPVEDCHSRQDRTFNLSASIVRHDPEGGRDLADASTPCGPYRSADHDDSGPASCALAVTLNHPEHETGVQYDVEVTYPGAAAQRTMRRFTVCTSDGKTAVCDQATP
jgi:hypothetical protein